MLARSGREVNRGGGRARRPRRRGSDELDAAGRLTWLGSGGFSVGASVRIEADDRVGIERWCPGRLLLCLDAVVRRWTEGAVDGHADLPHTGTRPVADPFGEDGLKPLPLSVRELDRVCVSRG